MNWLYYGYYLLLVITLILYLRFKRTDKELTAIGILIISSIITEGVVEWLIKTNRPYYYVYHFYGPVEYILLCLFFAQYITNPIIKKILLGSIPAFIATSLILSFSFINIRDYEGVNTIIRGFLLIIWAVIILFTLPYQGHTKLVKTPVFWICVAVMIFYAGTFFVNGTYNGLCKKYPLEKEYFQKIHNIINIVFNYLLYILIIIALICPKQERK